ncbi:MAG: UPF0280 family protein [Candidatus Brockarchaeota archaeon]|nr:UPF0280 family protein [Candidatus Brockarchaeota archaeon]
MNSSTLTYRNGLFYLRTTYKEADLLIASESISTINIGLSRFIEERNSIQSFLDKNPEFIYALEPLDFKGELPLAISLSVESSKKAGVGPMASLPGALADLALESMLRSGAENAIVENGGEISMKMNRKTIVGVYTGRIFNFGLILDNSSYGKIGISTSSSRVSHALSFGDADAVVVIAENAALADAVSTRVGNAVKSGCSQSMEEAVKLACSINGVKGCVVYSNDLISFGGNVKPIMLKSSPHEILKNTMLKGPVYNFLPQV